MTGATFGQQADDEQAGEQQVGGEQAEQLAGEQPDVAGAALGQPAVEDRAEAIDPDGGAAPPAAEAPPARPSRNEVALVGRVAAPPEERTLPSGDLLATFRVVVDRPPNQRAPAAEGPRRRSVDTLECAVWEADLRAQVAPLAAGDLVQVHGALRRRFWRTGAGAASRCEVEVVSVERLGSGRAD